MDSLINIDKNIAKNSNYMGQYDTSGKYPPIPGASARGGGGGLNFPKSIISSKMHKQSF